MSSSCERRYRLVVILSTDGKSNSSRDASYSCGPNTSNCDCLLLVAENSSESLSFSSGYLTIAYTLPLSWPICLFDTSFPASFVIGDVR